MVWTIFDDFLITGRHEILGFTKLQMKIDKRCVSREILTYDFLNKQIKTRLEIDFFFTF